MEKQIIYNVLDGEITFDPQIVEYGRLREEFNDYDDELAQSISKFYEENKSSIMDMYLGENKYYDFMFRLYAEITENIKEHMKKYINIMIDHGVYDVEEDYFTSTANDSLVRLLEIAGKEHEIKCILWEHHTDMFNSGLDEARVNAYSQVHGNTYGIITNSTAAKIMYGIENEYRIKKSTQRADAEYSSAITRIGDQSSAWFENKWMQEFVKYFEIVLSMLPQITDDLFKLTLGKYIECGIIKKGLSDNIDNNRSNVILKKLEVANNKKNVLLEALKADPFNKNVYKEIVKNNYMDDNMIQLTKKFGMENVVLEEIHSETKTFVSFRRIEDKNYQKLIKCLSRLSRLEEKDNKEWLLKEYKEIVGAELQNLGSKVYDDKTSESIFVYLLSKHKDMKKALEEYFTQLFIYWGVDSIEQVFSEEEQKDFFEKYIKLPSDANGAKKYFYDSFEESVEQKYENWIKEKNKLKDMDARRIQIGTEIAANTKIAYENRNKIFGEGARRKKDAKNKITQLTEERNELERDLETRNKQLSKETEIIPFVDIEIRPSDNDYISKTLYQSERKCRAGFISKEECSKMQQDAITRSFNDITAQYESVMKQL